MIYIITGQINSGKTTRMTALFHQRLSDQKDYRGDGIICPKVFSSGQLRGYDLVRLATGDRQPLAILKDQDQQVFQENIAWGPFVFSIAGFRFGEMMIRELLADSTHPDIYLDEIGPLELDGKGFAAVLHEVLQKHQGDIYLCIRSQCLEAVLTQFELVEYQLIER